MNSEPVAIRKKHEVKFGKISLNRKKFDGSPNFKRRLLSLVT